MRRVGPLLLSGLWGCAAFKPPPDPGIALLPPRTAGLSLTMTQEIGFIRGAARFDATALVEIDPQGVTLAGLGPFGNRLISMRWDGATLERELDPVMPKEFPAELILRDLQLVYWPEEEIRRELPAGWELKAAQGRRDLLYDGKEVIAIRFMGDRFKDPIAFSNKAAGYELAIRTLEIHHE